MRHYFYLEQQFPAILFYCLRIVTSVNTKIANAAVCIQKNEYKQILRQKVNSRNEIRSRSRKRHQRQRSDLYDEHREAEEGGLREKVIVEENCDAWHQVL